MAGGPLTPGEGRHCGKGPRSSHEWSDAILPGFPANLAAILSAIVQGACIVGSHVAFQLPGGWEGTRTQVALVRLVLESYNVSRDMYQRG